MKIITFFLFSGIILFSSCQTNVASNCEKPFIDLTDSADDIFVHFTSINDAGDTLFRIHNNTKATVRIMFKGDTATLVQDASKINYYSNSEYIMMKYQRNIMLKKNGNIVFLFP